MLHQLISYFKFLLNSNNQHGVHSPFVYLFITKGLYIKNNKSFIKKINDYKNDLKNNQTFINVTDFGAGSKIFKSNKRKVADIAKVAGISSKKIKLLLKIVQYFKPKSILEFGTSLGIGTYSLHVANKNTNIITLEGCKETQQIAINQFEKLNIKNTKFINSEFKNYIENSSDKFDLIYIDGNHNYTSTLLYFNQLKKNITNSSLLIFDDIYWSKEMTKAWIEIKNDEHVSLTIDLFYFGLVFFRTENLQKENFKIRA